MVWDIEKNSTHVLFDGLTSHDIVELHNYVRAAVDDFAHPFTLMTFVAELLGSYYTTMRQKLQSDIFSLERSLGITRGYEGFQGWTWNLDTLRNYTQRLYRLTIGPIYLERRLVFLISLAKFLGENLETLQVEVPNLFASKTELFVANKLQAERLDNIIHLASQQLHQTRCLDKRVSNLMTTVPALIPGKTSRC